ncbi:MAG: 50S ribosomal protein L25 [Candidatus Collierbacteria bacterium GW2011_GWB2_45_17]|uniref:Large ribosomal subunit protein bL25 n=2 Tax=Candidatus Collieribacteriota TaxID=1752725 RepID=A0A0G1NQP6_9BACT|nr:MAG: 50S ribosomal protein L25 [Microgenomates group bacterium GW2011_GWC1_44_23]KKT86534.1 MAG: 50S ribosomal protein L25 [Candidatus Collierbacteria bacterium GW2011_GWA2_44_99]KKT96046.1 MAG: 50S ribosomal protein L25 [Candidatus Collierbacteria bacterium GW2011_GWA1_45_15]KKU01080.1 MAG: 50S ribosomal protein L25 [Candidatus Collierbacteria bacterium GW2011_GWB2_45_17]KKU07973.1 MAG: 50S ribosomal protein L25 [Candidatus Collierbacteria bacterium GW2011_GWC2_45_40]HBC45172.1 50S ribosom
MNKLVLKAEKRLVIGSKVKKLRRQGIVPANVFGHTVKSQAIQVSAVEFARVYKSAGETGLIWIKVEGEDKERPTLIKALTNNPISGERLHVDFHQVNLKEKVTANVPVEIVGESQLVKDGLAVLDLNLHEIEVEALPTDLPENIVFDISGLTEIGAQLKVADVKLPTGVTLVTDSEMLVVALGAPMKEEPVEVPVTEEEVTGAEVPVEGAPVEGEKPAEESKPE